MNEPVVLKPREGHEYYSKDSIYWNSFDQIIAHMSRSVSGDPAIGWVHHVKAKYGVRNTGLFINCGNGWVERDCFKAGLVSEIVGFDITQDLLDAAARDAAAIEMPATYIHADGNNLSLDQSGFDLIVNNGSMHHIAYLDRLLRRMRFLLADSGIYVINDYTGAHRNQYSWEVWSKIAETNYGLPKEYQIKLTYAHMATMLALDPTEAIHSELAMDVTRRYFDLEVETRYGGAIAYNLLFGNHKLYRDRHTDVGSKVIEHILSVDVEFLNSDPSSNLLTFAVCRRKPVLPAQPILDRWTAEENEREAYAANNGGRYYPPTALELIYNEM
jgi:SAM-dependent methyltransferase